METDVEKVNHSNNILLKDIRSLIEQAKNQAAVQVNSTLSLLYWQVGSRINQDILQNERAEYGRKVIKSLAKELVVQHGNSFQAHNLHRMMQFAELYPDSEIVVSLTRQLSWTHIITIIPLKSKEAREFYINRIAEEQWSVRHTRKQIERKVFERSEIANVQIPPADDAMQHTFKDPYFLDFLDLKDGYLEKDLETAILKELEHFRIRKRVCVHRTSETDDYRRGRLLLRPSLLSQKTKAFGGY